MSEARGRDRGEKSIVYVINDKNLFRITSVVELIIRYQCSKDRLKHDYRWCYCKIFFFIFSRTRYILHTTRRGRAIIRRRRLKIVRQTRSLCRRVRFYIIICDYAVIAPTQMIIIIHAAAIWNLANPRANSPRDAIIYRLCVGSRIQFCGVAWKVFARDLWFDDDAIIMRRRFRSNLGTEEKKNPSRRIRADKNRPSYQVKCPSVLSPPTGCVRTTNKAGYPQTKVSSVRFKTFEILFLSFFFFYFISMLYRSPWWYVLSV